VPDFLFGLSGKFLSTGRETWLVERGSSPGREQTCPLLVGDAVHGRALGEGLAAPACSSTGCPISLGARGPPYTWVLVVWLLICSAGGMCVIVVPDLLFLQIQLSKRCWGAVSSMSEHPLPSHAPRPAAITVR